MTATEPHPLHTLLTPQSIAVVGASSKAGSLGHDTVEMMLQAGFGGEIFPVNPRYDEILGLTCYPSPRAIGKAVDLTVLCVAAKRLEEQVRLAIAANTRALVITANAILENDGSPNLADRIAVLCTDAKIPVCGDNAMGFYNNDIDLRVCGFSAPDEGAGGNIAFVTQSGSVFSTLAHNDPQLRFNLAITTGREMVTALAEYMDYALDQPSTKVIGIYLETIRKPSFFLATLRKAAEKQIPVVAMKVGRSKLGARFALSHSGGLAGDDDALQAVFDRYGVIRTKSLDELANTLLLHSRYRKIPQGGLVAIADSGGERNLLADVAEHVGIPFAQLSEATMTKLSDIQEYGQEADNPLDPWGTGLDFERIFGRSMAVMMADDNAAIGVLSQDLRDGYFLTNGCVQAIDIALAETDKPLALMTNFSGTRRGETTKALSSRGVPVLAGTRDALHAVRNVLSFRDYQYTPGHSPKTTDIEGFERLSNGSVLQEYDALALLAKAGIPTVKSHMIASKSELELVAGHIEYPVVLKTARHGILHKSDVGGVVLDINDFDCLNQAYDRMSEKLGCQALIQPMVQKDRELILGMKTDDTFGVLVIVGAGGTLTEYIKDSFTMLADAPKEEIVRKIESLRIYPVLKGVRGAEPIKLDDLLDTILRFGSLCQSLGGVVQEIDINPLHVSADQVMALDALIIGSK